MKKKNGFTLIELMVVVAIVGILTAVAVPKFGQMIEKANLGATLGNLSGFRSAIGIYYGGNAMYPCVFDTTHPDIFAVFGDTIPYVKATYPNETPPRGNEVTYGTTFPDTMGKGWYYDTSSGWININSIADDVYGISYSTY